jgi:hypothetical protein
MVPAPSAKHPFVKAPPAKLRRELGGLSGIFTLPARSEISFWYFSGLSAGTAIAF